MSIVFQPGTDLHRWSAVESVDRNNRFGLVPAPGRPGEHALRVSLKPTDLIHNGIRNEVVWDPKEPEGTERWYAWSTWFPLDFPTVEKRWQVWAQWHQSYRQDGTTLGNSPPVEFALVGDELRFTVNGALPNTALTLWKAPLTKGSWVDVRFHVKWSSNPAVGFVELWINNVKVVPRTSVATRFGDLTNYFKLGLYRAREIQPTAVILHSDFRAATTEADLLPVPPPVKTKIRFQVGGEWFFIEATKE